jgi:hypothetical protein
LTDPDWPELEDVLTSLMAEVAKDSDIALAEMLEWCQEHTFEIRAVTLEGFKPLTDSTLEWFLSGP